MSQNFFFTKSSLWIVNFWLKSYIFCFQFYLILYLYVLIRHHIPNTDPDPESSWIRIRIHNTAQMEAEATEMGRARASQKGAATPVNNMHYKMPLRSLRPEELVQQELSLVDSPPEVHQGLEISAAAGAH